MPDYYNIHTHKKGANHTSVLQINSLYENFGEVLNERNYYSIGLHPWYLCNAESDFQVISKLAANENVLAIGECGLDKVCGADWELQIKAFTWQIAVANEIKKPLVIHCVRAFDELLQVFKLHPPLVPVIIHGFNKKGAVADRLLAQGYYLSFGKAILTAGVDVKNVLKNMDGGRFFLETDDADVAIDEVYKKAAEIRETGEEEIILQVAQNFKTVFGI